MITVEPSEPRRLRGAAGLGDLAGGTPTLRIFALLELIAAKGEFVTLQGMVEETGLPKPTMHRMLAQLESAELLVRQSDGRHYGTGGRLRDLAEHILLNATQHGATHAVLRHLVGQVGESCNITGLSGDEVIYLDRIETREPLRFHLHPGSRVPAHASASGKMLLSQMSVRQRRNLLEHAPLRACTAATITDLDDLDVELEAVAERGWAVDAEEFLPGLVCVAMPIQTPRRRSNRCVAVQAPVARVPVEEAQRFVAPLRAAAEAIAEIEQAGSTGAAEQQEGKVS